ncbi:MAG: hypothetical protein K2X74_07825 [Acetobacteraceae bacterium]|nr:hypothetical protein [Acetobacteraceae bacterium]
MVRDNGYTSVDLFGAIFLARAVGAAVITPLAHAAAMTARLAEISTQVTPGAQAALRLDRAGWHRRGKRLRAPDNVTLLDLPPYRPALNPMEYVWAFPRGTRLSALVWGACDAIVEARVSAWTFLIDDREQIRSIGARDRACVGLQASWRQSPSPQEPRASRREGKRW